MYDAGAKFGKWHKYFHVRQLIGRNGLSLMYVRKRQRDCDPIPSLLEHGFHAQPNSLNYFHEDLLGPLEVYGSHPNMKLLQLGYH